MPYKAIPVKPYALSGGTAHSSEQTGLSDSIKCGTVHQIRSSAAHFTRFNEVWYIFIRFNKVLYIFIRFDGARDARSNT